MYWKKTPSILQKVFSKIIWRIPNKNNEVFLTFDDGPYPGVTDALLEILNEKKVTASFFCLGENIQNNFPLFEKIKAENHFIGNHGWSHLNGWKVSFNSYLDNLIKAEKYISNKVFRPPYGKMSLKLTRQLSRQYKIVMWDVMSGDFDANMDVDQCVQTLLKNVKSGSIIVFHDNPKSAKIMLKVVPILIDKLKEKAFRFGSISTLITED